MLRNVAKKTGRRIYNALLRDAGEFSGQPFTAMYKSLEQVLPLASTLARAILQPHACFFTNMLDLTFTVRIFEGAL